MAEAQRRDAERTFAVESYLGACPIESLSLGVNWSLFLVANLFKYMFCVFVVLPLFFSSGLYISNTWLRNYQLLFRARSILIQLKHSRGCCKCNYKNADQLCFHHRYIFQEHKNINDLLNKTDALMKELENCDILLQAVFWTTRSQGKKRLAQESSLFFLLNCVLVS